MASLLKCVIPFTLMLCPFAVAAKDYVVPAGDVGSFFATLPADATYLSFSASDVYSSTGDIVLPLTRMLVIDGRGARLMLGPASNGFSCLVADHKEATARLSGTNQSSSLSSNARSKRPVIALLPRKVLLNRTPSSSANPITSR